MSFYESFSPIISRWPKIPSADLDRIEFHCRGLSEFEMRRLCNMIIDTSSYTPTVPSVIECIKKIKSNRPQDAGAVKTYHCQHCRGTGYVNKWAQINGRWYEYAFGCPDHTCKAAEDKIPPSYTRWSDAYKDQYFDSYERNNP